MNFCLNTGFFSYQKVFCRILLIYFILDVCSYTMGSLISFFRRPELDTNSQLESIDSNLKRLFEKRAAHIRSKADLYTKTRNYG